MLRLWHFVDLAAANVGVGRYAEALKDLHSAEELYTKQTDLGDRGER